MVQDDTLKKRLKKKVVDSEKSTPATKQLVRISSNSLGSRPPEVAKRIRVYRNGDAFHKGINFVLNMRRNDTMHTLLDMISERIGLIQGAKRLYTVHGELVHSTQDLMNGNEYVASSGPFLPLPYGKLGTRRASFSATNGPRKEGTLFAVYTTKVPSPLTIRPSRSLEPRNRVVRQVQSTAGRKSTRTSVLSGESSMNNLRFAGLEIEAKTKPKAKKNKKLVQTDKVKKKKKVKTGDVETVPPKEAIKTEISPTTSIPPTIQSISKSESVRRESGVFILESRAEEEELLDITREVEKEYFHGYQDRVQYEENNKEGGSKKGKEPGHQSGSSEQAEEKSAIFEEHRTPTPAEEECHSPEKEDEDWNPAPEKGYKAITYSEYEQKNDDSNGEEAENLSYASPEIPKEQEPEEIYPNEQSDDSHEEHLQKHEGYEHELFQQEVKPDINENKKHEIRRKNEHNVLATGRKFNGESKKKKSVASNKSDT